MSDDHSHDIKAHMRTYWFIFWALVVGTILTVAVATVDFRNYFEFGQTLNLVIGLAIALTKATLVALFFMHLISEKTAIYLLVGFSFFFFAGLMGLTVWADKNPPMQTVNLQHLGVEEAEAHGEHGAEDPDHQESDH